jgi:hypothetical protein
LLSYKFLHGGHRGLFSDFVWPVREWVEVAEPLVPGRHGIHACRTGDLPHWLDDELWIAEVDGLVLEEERMLVSSRGRLLEQVDGWDAEATSELAAASVERGRRYPGGEDAAEWAAHPHGAVSAIYMVAHAAGAAAAHAGGSYDDGFADERAWQADWIVRRLGLDPLDA